MPITVAVETASTGELIAITVSYCDTRTGLQVAPCSAVSLLARDCKPGSRKFSNPEIPGLSRTQSRDFGINKIYLFNGLFSIFKKIILCIYSFFDAFLSPQWGGEGVVVLGPTCDRTRWLSGAQKLISEFRTFACV